jgi:hypothetical protein
MRALLLVGATLFLLGCRDSQAPSRRNAAAEASPEQVQALHAGNLRLAALASQFMTETKRMPANVDEVRTWAGARWTAEDEAAVKDPWGNKIFLNIQLSSSGQAITLRSMGADGKTSDDDLKYDSRDKATLTEAQRSSK